MMIRITKPIEVYMAASYRGSSKRVARFQRRLFRFARWATNC
jgi:hypothetical protein